MYNAKLTGLILHKHRHLILFLIILIIGPLLIWYLYNLDFENLLNENGNGNENGIIEEEIPAKTLEKKDEFSKIKEHHWEHMPITYKIMNIQDCKGDELSEARKAFTLIQNKTGDLVRFEETNSEPDIELSCVKGGIPREMEGNIECQNFSFKDEKTQISVYKEGILSPFTQKLISTELVSRTYEKTVYQICYEWGNYNPMMVLAEERRPSISNNLIKKGYVNLYLYGEGVRCAHYPAREVHEILHALGIAHPVSDLRADSIFEGLQKGLQMDLSREQAIEITKDSMFPYFNCGLQTKINEKYITCLKYIYSNGQEGNCSNVNFLIT